VAAECTDSFRQNLVHNHRLSIYSREPKILFWLAKCYGHCGQRPLKRYKFCQNITILTGFASLGRQKKWSRWNMALKCILRFCSTVPNLALIGNGVQKPANIKVGSNCGILEGLSILSGVRTNRSWWNLVCKLCYGFTLACHVGPLSAMMDNGESMACCQFCSF